MSSNQFVTIKTFTHPSEAAVIVSRLESEGIECILKDGLTAQTNPFYSNAIGGVKLQVRISDEEKATIVLKEKIVHDAELNQTHYESAPNNSKSVVCPSCKSTDEVSKPQISAQAFAIGILLLGFPLPFMSRTYHCFNCGIDFKKK